MFALMSLLLLTFSVIPAILSMKNEERSGLC
jgi:hypothetical protein